MKVRRGACSPNGFRLFPAMRRMPQSDTAAPRRGLFEPGDGVSGAEGAERIRAYRPAEWREGKPGSVCVSAADCSLSENIMSGCLCRMQTEPSPRWGGSVFACFLFFSSTFLPDGRTVLQPSGLQSVPLPITCLSIFSNIVRYFRVSDR